ncbi:MAG: hypothetical protein GF317_09985 [Candidatus Lokiarchaeota archaeon]|nr:hypothetical protein [Candidatus Lokiarchaeota archaeon]MBD3200005.1 hypothetical protein [Candidatus Lokiarchaeota archaeon]
MRSLADDQGYMNRTLRCGICHKVMDHSEEIFQSQELYIPVCITCLHRFTEDDIELMLNIFLVFGGYFGKFSSDLFCLSKIFNRLDQKRIRYEDIEQLNVKLLHTAILHGLSPKDFLKRLKNFMEK